MRRVVAFALFLPTAAWAQVDLRIPSKQTPTPGYGKVLPVGDSITVGTGFSGGWRKMLQEQLAREGVLYQFVGRNDPYAPMKQPYHEGHSSWRSTDILEGISGTASGKLSDWLTLYQPNTIILMIGTNDKVPEPLNQTAILDQIFGKFPHAKVVVGLIPPTKGNQARQLVDQDKRKAQIDAANRFKQQGFAIEIADTTVGFNPRTMLSDEVHPNESGYRVLTSAYRAALKRLWGF